MAYIPSRRQFLRIELVNSIFEKVFSHKSILNGYDKEDKTCIHKLYGYVYLFVLNKASFFVASF